MPEALPLQPGDPRRLGSYEITGRLGVGEQGAVFLGRDPAGRKVAVKLLHVRLSGEPVARSRFTGALAPARKVSGFCTAAILDADVEGDRPFVVSEWVDGPSLQQLVDEEGPRGGKVVERLAVGLAVALAAVHRAGALHHDLKPSNVLLGRDGPRLSDFGIARALEAVNVSFSGQITDDPSYMAPEQLNGRGIGPAADVFAWASTLLFAATGKPPFGVGTPSEVMHRIVYDKPNLTGIPDSVREAVAAAFAKDPAERPTARELLQRLLDERSPLADRMPPTMVAEGRALASGAPGRPRVQPGPQQGTGSHGPGAQGPAAAPMPPSPFPSPQTPPADPLTTPRDGHPPPPVAEPAPGMPSVGAPAGPAVPATSSSSAETTPTPALSLLGRLTRRRRSRAPEPDPDPTVADLDPAAFEETTTFDAFAPRHPDGTEHSDRTEQIGRTEQTMRLDPVEPDPTAAFDAIDPDGPGERGGVIEPPPPIVTGLGQEPDDDRGPSPLASLARMRRPGNHVLGVVLSLAIGVGVGIAIIALVLWPQLKADEDPPPDSANASNDRPVSTIPSSFGGTWKGTLVNTARNTSFPVEVTFEVGGTTGRAVYPKEGCTGTLRMTRGTESALRMSLSIDKPCTPGVVQVTRQPDGTLQYTWSRPGTNLGYGGRLIRS